MPTSLSRPSRQAAGLVFWLVCVAHILYTPYTKVEESWTLHTVHDIHHHGVSPDALARYDHVEHPCPVPRSFVGPLFLSALSWMPVRYLAPLLSPWYGPKLAEQVIVRISLATINAGALWHLEPTALLLTATQFHLPFWLGRTLPNLLAFPLAHGSFSRFHRRLGPRQDAAALVVLALTAAIFRVELLAFLVPLSLLFLLRHGLAMREILFSAGAVLVGIGASVGIDSYFWQQRVFWPEAISLIFNVYHGKSEEWGVEPWHFYFSRHLPKMLLSAYPLTWLSAFGVGRAQEVVAPMMVAVAIASKLRHKEWRFVVYALPSFNVGALDALRSSLMAWPKIRRLVAIGIFSSTLAATALLTFISHGNYPGGDAMRILHQLNVTTTPLQVHVDAYSAMTGASIYTYQNPFWVYNRSETLLKPEEYDSFDILVTHEPDFHAACFEPVSLVPGYAGIQIESDVKGRLKDLQLPLRLRWEPLVAIAQRKEACR